MAWRGGLLFVFGCLLSVASRRVPIVARLVAVLSCLFAVGVAGEAVERGVDARVPIAFALAL